MIVDKTTLFFRRGRVVFTTSPRVDSDLAVLFSQQRCVVLPTCPRFLLTSPSGFQQGQVAFINEAQLFYRRGHVRFPDQAMLVFRRGQVEFPNVPSYPPLERRNNRGSMHAGA